MSVEKNEHVCMLKLSSTWILMIYKVESNEKNNRNLLHMASDVKSPEQQSCIIGSVFEWANTVRENCNWKTLKIQENILIPWESWKHIYYICNMSIISNILYVYYLEMSIMTIRPSGFWKVMNGKLLGQLSE